MFIRMTAVKGSEDVLLMLYAWQTLYIPSWWFTYTVPASDVSPGAPTIDLLLTNVARDYDDLLNLLIHVSFPR